MLENTFKYGYKCLKNLKMGNISKKDKISKGHSYKYSFLHVYL